MNKKTLIIIILIAVILSSITSYRNYLEELDNSELDKATTKDIYFNKLIITFPITLIWTFMLIFGATWIVQKIFFGRKEKD